MGSNETLKSFVKGMEHVDEKIEEINPDYIIAPMIGAIPFIDTLNIINEDFDNFKVEYVPASNKIHNLKFVLRNWFNNFLDENASDNGLTLLSLDEVVSGNSLQRVYKQFDNARSDYTQRKAVDLFGKAVRFNDHNVRDYMNELKAKIKYKSVGVVDSKLDKKEKQKIQNTLI